MTNDSRWCRQSASRGNALSVWNEKIVQCIVVCWKVSVIGAEEEWIFADHAMTFAPKSIESLRQIIMSFLLKFLHSRCSNRKWD